MSIQRNFLHFALSIGAIEFCQRKLKSERVSSYFFNTGLFSNGRNSDYLGECYADAIEHSGINVDVLFGPAYKGIPLAVITAAKLYTE